MMQVHKLCNHYGPLINHLEGEAYHDFPMPSALTGNQVESHLRELGFGYRAKYIAQTARIVANEKPNEWLETLRNPEVPGFGTPAVPDDKHATYQEAHEQLLSLTGVGPKVADCVCLMGLGWGESVPVDTHVWQIAQRDYKFAIKKGKTLNKDTYVAVGDHFRNLWGKYAGWAHSVLFTADLREFADKPVKKEIMSVEVKKEEEVSPKKVTNSVEVKKEEVEEQANRRKRKVTIKSEVKTEIKLESLEEGNAIEEEKVIKRRRLRPRA